MPKLKTKSSAKKRFRLTAKGKVKDATSTKWTDTTKKKFLPTGKFGKYLN